MQSHPLPRLIGITGKAGTGKDTVATHLRDAYGYHVHALAAPLKLGIESMFGLPSTIWDRDQKEKDIPWLGLSPRYLAQTLGTEWGRRLVADDLWLRLLGRHVDELPEDATGIVVPDVRFDNEASFIRDRGGVIVRLVRDVDDVNAHVSEFGVSENLVDVEVINDADIPALLDVAEQAIDFAHNVRSR